MSGTRVFDTCRTTQLPSRCRSFRLPDRCSSACDVAVADDDVGLAAKKRRDERRNVLADVLIVAVGIDDEVGAELQAGVDARHERGREPARPPKRHDVIHAQRPRHFRRLVSRPIVDDEHLDDVDAGNASRKVAQASPAASRPR